ncbi:class I SAM-dependent methyltransferase [Nocardia sp. NPDC058499]|uniref:class I SAM-dependent methyltransferase n=1 Tax=Nocardia sp. NPDC058499 TaxID=3346530 RepID=UPI003654F531
MNNATEILEDFKCLLEMNTSDSDIAPSDPRSRRMRRAISSIYEATAAESSKGEIWNWGVHDETLAEELNRLAPDLTEFGTDGFSEQLYLLAVRDCPIPLDAYDGLTVLEVGCGLGEGLNLLSRFLDAKSMIGLDLAPSAVARANALLSRGDSLRFVQGDAEQLPFGDNEIDCVLNIESSHNYPNLSRFFSEVERVLRPGGVLSHVDLYTRARYERMERLKRENTGLTWIHSRDISPEVRSSVVRRMAPGSLFRTSFQRKMEVSGTWFLPRRIGEYFQMNGYGAEFAGVENDRFIRALKALRVLSHLPFPIESYWHHVAIKPPADQ